MCRHFSAQVLAAATVAPLLLASPAAAQLSGTVPPASHRIAIELLYDGDYRRAERGFAGDLRGAIKIGQKRWIDSICSHAMLGETYYHQGRNKEALAQFDQACGLVLAYPDWMRRVQFQQAPRPDTARVRRPAPWGQSNRQVVHAALPATQLISRGRINNNQQAETGGVVEAAQFWKVDVAEIVRCSALAIRRRNDLLGPLAETDRFSKELADTFARGGLTREGHWSNAWVALQLGLAQIGIRKDKQAVPHLARAMLLEGRYDHSLTGVALLAQAGVAHRAGDARAAAALYAEAALAGFSSEDLDVVTESLWGGYLHHAHSGAVEIYPPLEVALRWAAAANLDHVDWRCRHALVESLLARRQTSRAASVLGGASNRQRDLAAGRQGPRRALLSAWALMQQGNSSEAGKLLQTALDKQSVLSPRNFQTLLANARFDSGGLSPRLAVGVYRELLSDPTAAAWLEAPLDALAHLRFDHEPAIDRWFAASIARRETLAALEVSDLAKRRRFFRAQPLGGRRLGARRLLEPAGAMLDKQQQLERQALLAALPGYADLSNRAAEARQALAGVAPLVVDGRVTPAAKRTLERLGEASAAREALIGEAALSRLPTTLSFPPTLPTADAQQRLVEGDALLVFHSSGGVMHGFLVVGEDHHYWRLSGTVASFTTKVGKALRGLGNASPGRSLTASEATSNAWRTEAAELGKLILGGSRLDTAAVKRIIVVPDGPLWHVPMEVLLVGASADRGSADGAKPLVDIAPIRYAPTYGLALGDTRPPRPVRRTGLVLARASGDAIEREFQEGEQLRLEEALAPSTRLTPPSAVASPLLASAFDQLVVEEPTELGAASPYDWAPAPLDRSRALGSLREWLALPAPAPDRLLLTGARTLAESGLKVGRRSKGGSAGRAATGGELFQAACGLLAAGPQTILMTRWATGGAIHGELVREFAGQMNDRPPADAWRRSVRLARELTLDPPLEPRLAWSERSGDPPLATHPFFWSGYLLIDAGVDPSPAVVPPPAEAAAPGAEEPAAAKPAGAAPPKP